MAETATAPAENEGEVSLDVSSTGGEGFVGVPKYIIQNRVTQLTSNHTRLDTAFLRRTSTKSLQEMSEKREATDSIERTDTGKMSTSPKAPRKTR